MRNVVDLRLRANTGTVPTLVLLDLQQEYVAPPRLFAIPEAANALENCRIALAHSRRLGLPVAFFRMVARSAFFNPVLSYSKWIPGFEPMASDMVFERGKPSCYANREFAHSIAEGGGNFVLAGFSGEGSCLATVLDAFHRDHNVTFLADASASHQLGQNSENSMHETIIRVIGLYGKVTSTESWISEQPASAISWTAR